MHLPSPTSAILSAVIFNALIIPLLIPVALKGVRYRPIGADALLLASQRVRPEKLLAMDYPFQFEDLGTTLRTIIGGKT